MILAVIAIPIAIAGLFLGARRVSFIAIYWAVAAFLAVPLARHLPMGVDDALILLGIGGLMLSALFWFNYASIKTTV